MINFFLDELVSKLSRENYPDNMPNMMDHLARLEGHEWLIRVSMLLFLQR